MKGEFQCTEFNKQRAKWLNGVNQYKYTYIFQVLQHCTNYIKEIIWLLKYQWSNPEEYRYKDQ